MLRSDQFAGVRLCDSRVKPVTIKFAAEYILRYEYMGSMPGFCSHAFGHFFGDACGGVEVFGSPAGQRTAMFPGRRVIQLKRGVSLPGTPHSSPSFLISKCLIWLRKNTDFDVAVAFANPIDGELGVVYQRSNWVYTGLTNSGKSFIIDGDRVHERTLQDRHGTRAAAKLQAIYGDRLVIHSGVAGKHRYFYSLRKDLIIPSQPYPKRAVKDQTA